MTDHDLSTLLSAMASPDPTTRDGWAYAELSRGILSGRFAASSDEIRASAIDQLSSPHVQARTFAPLTLAWLVLAGDRDRGAFEQLRDWYTTESDTRGYDDRLGWLHAVAHGADYFAEAVKAGIAGGGEVLETLAVRMVFDGQAWHDQEYARVAGAAIVALSVDPGGHTVWLGKVVDALAEFERAPQPARPPDWIHNVYTTLAAAYVALCEQPVDGQQPLIVAEASAIADAVARLLARMTPWLLRTRAEADGGVSY
ncbi:uncharacterized protein DUF2785 [Branchiibius hedensis]|uniref:DUF2785 domain-containing protein n=1 Tax=Branchiibius hedensis TaxID=672460 RepID=A0A2Y8ZLK5_9MICO|nr:DUF2785 domain-containing protein [Branchiibius hedensis]PWJ24504.1 uncharacterized protein DUF2785 [Branchiibius hedensis]SSA33321.1 Protein of unknown function [Branchiibius hedensis]